MPEKGRERADGYLLLADVVCPRLSVGSAMTVSRGYVALKVGSILLASIVK